MNNTDLAILMGLTIFVIVLIVILTILLIFSFLGINLLLDLGNFLQSIVVILTPLLTQILSVFGYTAGTVLDKTEDVATSVAKAGIDIAGGTVQSVADLLKNSSANNVDPQARSELDKSLNSNKSMITYIIFIQVIIKCLFLFTLYIYIYAYCLYRFIFLFYKFK